MMPVKVIRPIHDDYWLDMVIVGVGKAGQRTIEKLSQKVHQLYHNVDVSSLLLMDDTNFASSKCYEEIKRADVLFSIVDLTEEESLPKAYEIAKGRDEELSVCVCYGEYDETLKTSYDNVILVDDKETLDDVLIMVANMMRSGLVGVDFANILSMLRECPFCYYDHFNLADIADIDRKVRITGSEDTVNALVHITTTSATSLEEVNTLIMALYDVFQGKIVWNTHETRNCKDNRFYLSMVYGRNWKGL